MSIPVTIFVPHASRAWTSSALADEIRNAGFDLSLEPFVPETHVGSIPGTYKKIGCYFEYSRDSIDQYLEAVDDLREEDPDDFPYSDEDLERVRSHHHIVQLVTHSGAVDRVAAVVAAANLAVLTGGWVLDEPVWAWHSGADALEWARQTEQTMAAQVAEEVRRGTRDQSAAAPRPWWKLW